ncbi:MAG: PilT/PilU family type 4a pilus ATPase [Chitinispirillaceae bacterium]|nr:PilT/PilU family type 4a pilus ATPase [Chitinispirillaceae bacterium]
MQIQQPVDNNKLANLIISRKFATVDHVRGMWPYISPTRDIGKLLVECGLLPEPIYKKMVEYLNQTSAPRLPSESQPQSQPVDRVTRQVEPGLKTQREESNSVSKIAEVSDQQPEPSQSVISADISITDTIQEMFSFARNFDASDLHLSVNNPVIVRKYGTLLRVTDTIVTSEKAEQCVRQILTGEQFEQFTSSGDIEFVYDGEEAGRFRVTVIKQRFGWDVTARCIPKSIMSFEETGMPLSCKTLTEWAQGLVLVTGPTCCGKSASLATLVQMINQHRKEHVITLESPIEYLYTPEMAQMTQREIGKDTQSQESALRAALREDPDVIVVGELRDLSTMQLAVSAAETGHLVFATMNTISASRTIYRLIDSFPPEEQGIIRNMVSESLRGIISQQLIARMDGTGMVAAYEVLIVNSAVANMIRKDEAHQLGTAMITGKANGMQILDDSLRALAMQGIISQEEATSRSMVKSSISVK